MRVRRQLLFAASEARRGYFLLPEEGNVEVLLTPAECALFRLFLAHPEGITTENIARYKKELQSIYAKESIFDEPARQDAVVESMCAESKKAFYTLVSRIKRKFVNKIGAKRADRYVIKRTKDGVYRTKPYLIQRTASSK